MRCDSARRYVGSGLTDARVLPGSQPASGNQQVTEVPSPRSLSA
jgi:hypothetical protein